MNLNCKIDWLPMPLIYGSVVIALCVIVNHDLVYAQDPVQNPRHINLTGQSNFRDIGGYKTVNEYSVKWKTVYRSGELPRLSDKDITKLGEFGIATVVNFLTKDEINARGQDRLPKGVKEIFLPISGEAENDLAKVVLEARQTADFSNVPVELNPEVHRILVGDAAKEQYASLQQFPL